VRKALLIILLLGACTVYASADDFFHHGSFLWNNIRAVVSDGDYLYCAMHDGIGVIDLSLARFRKHKLAAQLPVAGRPLRLHLFDDILVTETETGQFAVIDISDPLRPLLLDTFRPDVEVTDLERSGDFIYAAAEYDGLLRYSMADRSDIRFLDSSMYGIHVTRLVQRDGYLFALDDYNGILIYDADATDITFPRSELLLPEQAISFTVFADTVFAGIRPTGYMVASIADIDAPTYIDSHPSFIRADQIAMTSPGLILFNSINGLEVVTPDRSYLHPLEGIAGIGSVFTLDQRAHIVYPHHSFGFRMYDFEDPESIIEKDTYAVPGPITQVSFINSRLHVVGTNSWYESYDVSTPERPLRVGAITSTGFRPSGVCAKGDTLFVGNANPADLQRGIWEVRDTLGGPLILSRFISMPDSIGRPYIIPDYFDDGDLIYYYTTNILRGMARTETSLDRNRISWNLPVEIQGLTIVDTVVYVADAKNIFTTYAINEDFGIDEFFSTKFAGSVNQMVKYDTLLLMANNAGILRVSIKNLESPEFGGQIYITGGINEMEVSGDWLVCIGGAGIHVLDLTRPGLPELFSGGMPGKFIGFDPASLIFAVSDGYSVSLFSLLTTDAGNDGPQAGLPRIPRLVGYPNPFNPTISLKLYNFGGIAEHIALNVYDILGRRVAKLPVRPTGTESFEAVWDGKTSDGKRAASGAYLIRAAGDGKTATFKAILLK
jgi:hypothetical protein